MLPIDETPGSAISPRSPKLDPIARAVQIGLMIYLFPVVMLVTVVGGIAIIAGLAGRFAFKPEAPPSVELPRIVLDVHEGEPQVERRPRRVHALH